MSEQPVSKEIITHELKCWPEFFGPILDGSKTFEIREDDRDYAAGHYLRLREWNQVTKQYTGREVTRCVTYVTDFAQCNDFVVMALADISTELRDLQRSATVKDYLTVDLPPLPAVDGYERRQEGHYSAESMLYYAAEAVRRSQPPADVQRDAERYRWLTEDITDSVIRGLRNNLLERIAVMSHGAASAEIDRQIAHVRASSTKPVST